MKMEEKRWAIKKFKIFKQLGATPAIFALRSLALFLNI